MSFLKNAKIRTKILSLIVPICAIGIAGIAMMSNNYKTGDNEFSELLDKNATATIQMVRASQRLASLSYNGYQVLSYSSQDPKMATFVAAYEQNKKDMTGFFEGAKKLLPANAAAIDGIFDKAKAAVAVVDEAIKAGKVDQDQTALDRLKTADPIISDTISSIRQMNTASLKDIADTSAALTETTDNTIFYTLLVVGLVFCTAIVTALIVSARGITTPIRLLQDRMGSLAGGETEAPIVGLDRRDELGQMASAVAIFRANAIERVRLEREADANRSLSDRERMDREAQKAKEAADTQLAVDGLAQGLAQLSDGNVTYRIETPFVSHLDGLRNDFNSSIAKLHEALRAVGQNAEAISGGANEIRSSADDLAKRTEQQAASVEETAAALEQITTTVKDSTRRAETAGQLVTRARVGAEKSGEVMREAVAAMQGIEKSSNEISNIIGVIDEIAFQTNLLALNAGVEAARAGEAGKGFAVVAQEVRELAQRSAKAAKEIKALISTSSNQVRNGVDLVARTGESLSQIVGDVEEIDSNVRAIVEAAREQSTGLHEINTAVNTIDQGTQQNAAMVEESTAASHSLAKEVSSLTALLGQFNVGENRSKIRPTVANERHAAAASPARGLRTRIAGAFGNASAAPAVASWEDF